MQEVALLSCLMRYVILHTGAERTLQLSFKVIKREEVKSLATKATESDNRDKADRRAGPRQGPYVRSGMAPRARNTDGTWRKKRSDAGKKRGK
jgi:hypothetical protein